MIAECIYSFIHSLGLLNAISLNIRLVHCPFKWREGTGRREREERGEGDVVEKGGLVCTFSLSWRGGWVEWDLTKKKD